MQQFQDEQEAYDWCLAEGQLLTDQQILRGRILANVSLSEEDLAVAQDCVSKKRWNSAFKNYYDVLHQLADAFLLIDGVKSRNHLCLFSYLCSRHPELEFDWHFLEKIRTRRNGLHYYGTLMREEEWKEVSLGLQLYVELLKEKVEEYLHDH